MLSFPPLRHGRFRAGSGAALLACGLVFAPAAQAETWWLAGSAEQEAFNEEFADLFATPADPETMGRFAGSATRIGNFEAAIGTLERILLLRPHLTPVRLELGVLYYRIGAYETALFHLRKALSGRGLAAAARARGQTFLEAAEGKLSRHAVTGVVSLGLRYQTNANAATSESVVRLGGTDFTATNDEEGDFNLFLSGRLQHSYDLGTQYDESWDSEVVAHATKQFDFTDADLGFAEVRSGPLLSVVPGTVDFLTVQPFLLAGLTAIDRDFNNHWGGGGAELKKRFGSLAVARARYSARYRDFDQADDRDGLLQTLDLSAGLVVTEDIVVNAGVALTDEAADRDFRANWRLGLKAGVTARYDAPFGLTAWPWQLSLRGSWEQREFDEADPAADPNVERSDDRWRITVKNTVGLAADWSLFFEFDHVTVDSNLPNNQFDNSSASIGASWRF